MHQTINFAVQKHENNCQMRDSRLSFFGIAIVKNFFVGFENAYRNIALLASKPLASKKGQK